ncbi:MAG: acyl-CoA dehydrogenase family protein, partial [Burkholderiales bacterium]
MNVFDRIDASVDFSDEERMLIESVRSLARGTIASRAAEYDRSGAFPWENVKAINTLG